MKVFQSLKINLREKLKCLWLFFFTGIVGKIWTKNELLKLFLGALIFFKQEKKERKENRIKAKKCSFEKTIYIFFLILKTPATTVLI